MLLWFCLLDCVRAVLVTGHLAVDAAQANNKLNSTDIIILLLPLL
jgi:hypothetical protein